MRTMNERELAAESRMLPIVEARCIISPRQSTDRFDLGENEAIALASERGAVFLYDQGRLASSEVTTALAHSQAARRVVREALTLLAKRARRKGGSR